jgi:hypothetical protein
MRPIESSTKLKKCKNCGLIMEKSKTMSWNTYQTKKKYCSKNCGTIFQFRNGMPNTHKQKISDSLKGRQPWNFKNATIKKCIYCGNSYKAVGKRKYTGKYCSMLCRTKHAYINEDINKINYYKKVWKITESQPLHLLDGYNRCKRTRVDIDKNAFHIDHIKPIIYGYKNNIPPEEIGNINNLRFISAVENHKKSKNIKL